MRRSKATGQVNKSQAVVPQHTGSHGTSKRTCHSGARAHAYCSHANKQEDTCRCTACTSSRSAPPPWLSSWCRVIGGQSISFSTTTLVALDAFTELDDLIPWMCLQLCKRPRPTVPAMAQIICVLAQAHCLQPSFDLVRLILPTVLLKIELQLSTTPFFHRLSEPGHFRAH